MSVDPSAVPVRVVPARAVHDLDLVDLVDLEEESPRAAARAERQAQQLMGRIDLAAEAIVEATARTGWQDVEIVVTLRRAAARIERGYRWRDQKAHHGEGGDELEADPAALKTRHRVLGLRTEEE